MSEPARPLAVFDIDGVVADVSHRLHHIRRRPKSWSAFFAAAGDDTPLAEGVELVRKYAADHDIVWLTGRPRNLARLTRTWLAANGLPEGRLVTRPGGDFRPSSVVKAELLANLAEGRTVGVVVDDNHDVVTALRDAGWPVLLAEWAPPEPELERAQDEGRT